MLLRFDTGRPLLHKLIYLLCLPAFPTMVNAIIYHVREGTIGWATLLNGGGWDNFTFLVFFTLYAADTLAAVLLLIFALSKRVQRSSKWNAALAVAAAWICTLIASVPIDL